jgi:acyl carrier protein
MNEAKIAAFGVALVVVVCLVLAQQVSMKRHLRAKLASRERVPSCEFGSRYYTDTTKSEIATFILQRIELLTDHDFAGALPTDSLTQDLRLEDLDSMVLVEILVEVEQRFQIKIENEDALRIKTIDDFVEIVHAKGTRVATS